MDKNLRLTFEATLYIYNVSLIYRRFSSVLVARPNWSCANFYIKICIYNSGLMIHKL